MTEQHGTPQQTNTATHEQEALCLARAWFYRFELPSGRCTQPYVGDDIALIHETRWQMLQAALAETFPGTTLSQASVLDLACHQGWFTLQLAAKGIEQALGLDARASHVADASLMANTLGISNVAFQQADVTRLDPTLLGQHDIVLCLGLIYHLENPIGALRIARALTRKVCYIETQIAPGLSGPVDYGSYRFVKPIEGSFAIVDETDETHGPETSTTGICLVPSLDALRWILAKVGFSRTEVLPVPEGGYEQLAHGKRVMLAAYP